MRVSVCSSVLPCISVCCSVLQCVAVRCSVSQCVGRIWGKAQKDSGWNKCLEIPMGRLRLVGSLKLYVTLAEYRLFRRSLLQKRRIILRSLLIVATPQVHGSTNAALYLPCIFAFTLYPCIYLMSALYLPCIPAVPGNYPALSPLPSNYHMSLHRRAVRLHECYPASTRYTCMYPVTTRQLPCVLASPRCEAL